jgi:hypothetical protein
MNDNDARDEVRAEEPAGEAERADEVHAQGKCEPAPALPAIDGKPVDGTERLVDRFPAWMEACRAAGVVIPESTPRGKVA